MPISKTFLRRTHRVRGSINFGTAMAKTLDNAMSHTVRRGHISGAEFAVLEQYHVIMITPLSAYVSNRHPLPPRI